MRKCIKCGRTLPLGQFDDNWRHNTNICKACVIRRKNEYKGKTTREGRILNDQH